MTVDCADKHGQGCSLNAYTVDSVDIRCSATDTYAGDTACENSVHEYDECEAELGALYIETSEDVAMETAIAREWALLDSMYVRSFLEAERAVAYGDPRAPAVRSGLG
jgi:hypothetical protein